MSSAGTRNRPSALDALASYGVSDATHDAVAAALDSVGEAPSDDFLQPLAEVIPLAVGVDFANIRLLGVDGRLYLVAASGCLSTEVRKRALQPLDLDGVRRMVACGAHDALARSLGILRSYVFWIGLESEPLGAIALGCRTERRPGAKELALADETAQRLAERLSSFDGWRSRLGAYALALARRFEPVEWPSEVPAVSTLRPRERSILELYADGLTTQDIVDLLVISPHTIRTHVKLALRRLGVHSRDEAAALVRAHQVAEFL